MSNTTEVKCLFIFGVIPRSGTNYLTKLLLKHPEIKRAEFNAEDKLFISSDLLIKYSNKTKERWFSKHGIDKDLEHVRLREKLGEAIHRFLEPKDKDCSYALTKTPQTFGIDNLPLLLPNAKAIILLRSGRDAIESGRKSFGWPYKLAIDRYKASLERIQSFKKKYADSPFASNFIIVKYEDLFKDEEKELKKIFDFIQLPSASYPFSDLKEMKVVGSSTSKADSGEQLDWQGFKKDEKFDPSKRSEKWPSSLVRYYYKNMNTLLAENGYEKQALNNSFSQNTKDSVQIYFSDLKNIFSRVKKYSISTIIKKFGSRLKTAFRILIFGLKS